MTPVLARDDAITHGRGELRIVAGCLAQAVAGGELTSLLTPDSSCAGKNDAGGRGGGEGDSGIISVESDS